MLRDTLCGPADSDADRARDVAGLYFCGLAFQYASASMAPGVARDARYVVDHLVRHRPAITGATPSRAA